MHETGHVTLGDGCRLGYRLDGDPVRPVLMLSNSIATDLRMWDEQVGQLTESFLVLRYDTRGHGSSDAPAGSYSIDRLGRDVIELLDHLGIARVHFCGLSLGGFVGQWLGVRAPHLLERLVLSNTSPYLGPATQWDASISELLHHRDMSIMADKFITNWFPAVFREQRNEVVERFREMALNTSVEGLAGSFAVVRDADLRRTNQLIETPTLVIGGEFDTVTLGSHSEDIARSIPRSQLVILPGVHMLNVELPIAFMGAIRAFLLAA